MNGRHAEAIQATLTAIRLEPLRETAHAALVRAYLAEGNHSKAVRQFYRCRDLLSAESTVDPSESIVGSISNPVWLLEECTAWLIRWDLAYSGERRGPARRVRQWVRGPANAPDGSRGRDTTDVEDSGAPETKREGAVQ